MSYSEADRQSLLRAASDPASPTTLDGRPIVCKFARRGQPLEFNGKPVWGEDIRARLSSADVGTAKRGSLFERKAERFTVENVTHDHLGFAILNLIAMQ